MKMPLILVAGLGLAAIMPLTVNVSAQGTDGGSGPGSLDVTFDPTAGGTRVGLSGGSPIVHAVLPQPDGRIWIGGWFNGVNSVLRNNFARLNADGSLDPAFQPSLGVDGTVEKLAPQADGKVVIIGSFRTANGQPHPLIARLNADGSVDDTFSCQLLGDANLRLSGVAVLSSGRIWIAGQFTNVNGVARHNLARLNADGSLDASFDPDTAITGANRYVETMCLQADGRLLLAGAWEDPQRSLIRLNADGSLDAGFTNVFVWEQFGLGRILDLSSHSNGTVVIAGYFFAVNGVPRHHVARLNTDGSVDTGFNPGTGPDFAGLGAVLIQPDEKVVLGGAFHEMNGVEREGLARLNADGSVDMGFDPANAADVPPGYHAGIYDLAPAGDGRLLVAAAAWWQQDTTDGVFRLSATGQREPEFSTPLQAPPEFAATLALQPDGKVILSVDGSYMPAALLRLLPNGLRDEGFVPGTNFGFVHAVALQPDGRILVAATAVDDPQTASVVRLLSDGDLDTSFRAPIVIGGEAPIERLALQPDGKILVGGLVWNVEDHPHQGIVRLHPDGSFDTNFHPVPISVTDDPGYGVEHIFVLPGGRIFIAGGFKWETAGPAGIALLESDGMVNQDFASNVTTVAYVYAAARQADGKVILSGYFPEASTGIIRINPDGTSDHNFQPEFAGQAHALAVQADGRIVLTTGDPNAGRITRLNSNGSLDTVFPAEAYPWGVDSLLLQPDGQVLVVGGFHSVSGIPRHSIARLNNDVRWRLDVAPQTIPGQFQLTVSGQPGARLIIEASSDLINWTAMGGVTTVRESVSFADTNATQFAQRFYRAREKE